MPCASTENTMESFVSCYQKMQKLVIPVGLRRLQEVIEAVAVDCSLTIQKCTKTIGSFVRNMDIRNLQDKSLP